MFCRAASNLATNVVLNVFFHNFKLDILAILLLQRYAVLGCSAGALFNIVYDGHAQQKLVTPHIRDRSVQPEKKKKKVRCAKKAIILFLEK